MNKNIEKALIFKLAKLYLYILDFLYTNQCYLDIYQIYYILNNMNVNYLSILKYVDAVIGNSSSGIYEVPSFRKPTVNLGNRQEGRLMAKSVINSKINKKFIIQAINKVYSKKFRKKLKKIKNPYTGKNASNNMIKILLKYDFSKFKKNI